MSKPRAEKIPYGRIIAAACFSIQAIGIGIYVAFGVFFNPLMSEFGWSRAVISGASSVAFFVMGLFGIVVGRFNDRFGPRIQMTVTAIFLGLGYGLMSRITSVWQLYLFYGLFFGIGLSSIDVIALTTITRWFSRNRGMMTGIVKVGTGAGQFLMPLVAGTLISRFGWRNAYVIIGSIAMVLLILIAQLLKRDPIQRGRPMAENNPSLVATPDLEGKSIPFKTALRTRQLWILCILNLTLVFCMMIIIVHIVPHARDIGIPAPLATAVLSTIGGISMLGRVVIGLSIDRIGCRKAALGCLLVLIVGLLWIQLADEPWMLFLFAGIYGLAHGAFFTAISPIVAELFGVDSHGALLGIVVFFGTVGGSCGPTLAGYIFDRTGSYMPTFWIITVMSVIGLGLMFSLKPIQSRG